MAPGFILGAFFFSPLIGATTLPTNWESLAKTKQWLNLVHYKKNIFGSWVGQPDGEISYLHPKGKTNPKLELKATLEKFFENDQKTICQFPARYKFLSIEYKNLSFNLEKNCSQYFEFKKKLNAKSVSLIFSSYFINSPASAFGHTFLRMNSTKHDLNDKDQAELLDYGVNFSAIMNDQSVLFYPFKAIGGFYPGTFTALPYYYKVREYNDFESRDLWEYKLDFSQDHIDMMVAHLWELGPTYFDYKFFTENCSYHILGLLEVGNPDLKLTDRLPSYYVIPIDTIRILFEEKNFVLGHHFRPSVLTRLENRSKGLSSGQKKIIQSWIKNPQRVDEALKAMSTEEEKVLLLDAAIDAYDFAHASDLTYEKKEANKNRFELLTQRAMLPINSGNYKIEPDAKNYPQNGHRSQRYGATVGQREEEVNFATVSMRFALHDLLDPLPGQPTFSQIHFADITARYEDKKLFLDNLDLFRVSSFQPLNHWQKSLAWTAKMGMRTIQDLDCVNCLAGNFEGGGGVSINPFDGESFIAILAKGEFDYSGALETNARTLVGPELWWRYIPNHKWSMLHITGYKWLNGIERPRFDRQVFTHSMEIRYHASKEISLQLKGQRHDTERHSLEFGFYRFF